MKTTKKQIIIFIIAVLSCVNIISYGAGAQDSNPNVVLGGGTTTNPYAPGIEAQIQANEQYVKEHQQPTEDDEKPQTTGTVTKQNGGTHSAGEIVDEAQGFIDAGKKETQDKGDPISGENLQAMSSMIYNILLVVGIIIAVAIAVILGIKFVTGGVEGQAEVKSAIIPFVVGCVIIFGAFTIWKVVLIMLNGIDT
jgi:hypothetical protein